LLYLRQCGGKKETEFYYSLPSQDEHTAAWSLFLATSNAFGFWMDVVSCLFVSGITLTFFLLEGSKGVP
jgi:hypothetical protein